MNEVSTIPTEKEIAVLEQKLALARESRAKAMKQAAKAIKSDEIINALTPEELVALYKKLHSRIRGNHKRRRGSPVSETLKDALIKEIIRNEKSLSEMSDMLGLSISYISKVKKHLKESGVLPQNAYTDFQFRHHQKDRAQSEITQLQPA